MTLVTAPPAAPPRFVADAEAFAARWGADPLFGLLGWVLRCSGEDLALVVKKVHSMSVPGNTHEPRETLPRAYAALLLLPAALAARRALLWRPAAPRDWDLETISPSYFRTWFSELYDALPGAKCVTPRAPANFGGVETTAPILASACAGDLLRLAVAAPAAAFLALRLARRSGVDVAQAWRKAASIYVSHRGHFRRFPSRVFITYADELNHPARWLAFRQTGGETLAVVQNGERTLHPSFAFGRADRYFVFGPRYAEILRLLGVRGSLEPVGALCLNEFHAELSTASPRTPDWDVLYFDQGFSHNGLPDATNASLARIAENLGRLQEKTGLRVAYQLRPYSSHESARRAVTLETVARYLPRAAVLENRVRGDSYRHALKADLLLTFQSTIGFEMMRLGKKVLFVNYSGDPTETVCRDGRFQLEDAAADFTRFEEKVRALLALHLDGPPAEALDRHAFFDGAVQRRVADALRRRTP